jgi:glyoxylase-like metal-dependent hydrolase (beta-lactamase superfamily II)/ketosteroid isomerase-like protein
LLLESWPAGGILSGQTGDELPLHTQKFSDKVLFAWVGDYMQTIRVVALSTARGLVVIETNLSRSADVRIRRAIEEAFGRKDFKYLINTHFHHDHTAGNQVYADATIVGQATVPEGMRGELTGEGLVKQLDKFKGMEQDWAERQKKATPDSREFHFFREGLILLKTVIQELQTGFTPTFPSVLFDKSLTLDMGDMTLELYAVGGTHTTSDIMIFVPEEGLVAVGDMWPDQVLPYLSKKAPWDLGAILENWGRIVDNGREIKHINFAHSDMTLSVETFKQQYRYLKTLWDGLRDLRAKGATLEEAKTKYAIERDFPYFKDKRLKVRDLDIHQNNVEAIWDRIGGRGANETGPKSSNDEAIITKVIHDSFAWALTKDRALFESLFAKDDDFFTYYPDSKSTVVGWAEFQKYLERWMDPRNKALSFDIRDLRLVMAKTGDVAWFSAVVDDSGKWDGKPWGSKDVRWTAILEKREGRWVIVQQHMSLAVDKVLEQDRRKE